MTNPNPFLRSPLDTLTDDLNAEAGKTLASIPEPVEVQAPETVQEIEAPKPARRPAARVIKGNVMPPPDLHDLFEASASHYGVPVNVLMALASQESNYNPTAIGPQTKWGRGKGIMQNLDATASGLGINPMDPNEAVPAAAMQLSERLKKGMSMEEAVMEHFAGPDRKLWGEKTAAYGREVMERVAKIGEELAKSAPPAPKAGPAADPNNMGIHQDRAAYEASLRAANPNANPAMIDMALAQFDQEKVARGQAALQVKQAGPKSPEQVFNERLDAKLAAKRNKGGIVPPLPSMAQAPLSEEAQGLYRTPEGDDLTDAANNFGIGANAMALNVREALGRIPVAGDLLVEGADAVAQAQQGGAVPEILARDTATKMANLSPEMRAAQAKKWWDEDKGTFGEAWSDPRSYSSGIVQSLPEMALTMLPAVRLAKMAYTTKLAAGATAAQASAAAARTAALAGAVTEGALGGAASAREVRTAVQALPDDVLAQSEAFQALISEGMNPEEARAALAQDLSTRAFVMSGTVTGLFGGMGDRAIAKIFTDQVGQGVVRRALSGFGKGAVGEGVLEELPQSAGQKLAQNEAMQQANPNQALGEDVLNQALGGMATGAVQGGAMGGVVGAASASPAAPEQAPPRIEPVLNEQSQPAPEAQQPASPPAPVPAPVAPPVADKPVTAAVESVSKQAPQRARVITPDGEIEVTVNAYQDNGDGTFIADVTDDEGVAAIITHEDGIQVQMIEPEPAGPLTAALGEVAQGAPEQAVTQQAQVEAIEAAPPVPEKKAEQPAAEQPAPQPEAPAAPVETAPAPAPVKAITDMDDAELAERLAYVKDVAKRNGATKMTVEARRDIEREMKKRVKAQAKEQANGLPERGSRLGPNDVGGRSGSDAVLAGPDNGARPSSDGPVSVVGQGDAGRSGSEDAVDLSGASATADAKPALTKRQPPKRHKPKHDDEVPGMVYENGNAWVHEDKKKNAYVVFTNGLTHATSDSAYTMDDDGLSLARARADHLAKRQPPKRNPKKPTLGEARAMHDRQEEEVRKAAENIAKRKAEKAAQTTGASAPTAGAKTDTTGANAAAEVQAPAQEAKTAPRKPAKRNPKKADIELADYFAPGNVVKAYRGHDRVIEYTPSEDGGFSVKVQAVEKKGDEWVPVSGPAGDVRTHSTRPDARALKAGPIEKSKATEEAKQSTGAQPNKGMNIGDLIRQLYYSPMGGTLQRLVESGVIDVHNTVNGLPQSLGEVPEGLRGISSSDGVIHLIAGNLTPRTAMPVLLHEMFHRGGKRLIGTREWTKLMGRMAQLHQQGRSTTGAMNKFWAAARARVNAASKKGAVNPGMEPEEFAAYAIEEYASAPLTVRKWVDDLIGLVKAWALARFGKQLGDVTPAQLKELAKMAMAEARAPAAAVEDVETVYSVDRRNEPRNTPDRRRTIEVDGVRRPIEDSKGRKLGNGFMEQMNFWKWAKDTKIVDDAGHPMVMYHGTKGDITQFDEGLQGSSDFGASGRGFYFSADPGAANVYAALSPIGDQPNVMPVYLQAQNPYEADMAMMPRDEAESREFTQRIQDAGHDAIIVRGNDGVMDEVIVFDPKQIKSATANNGKFDPASPDIRYSVDGDTPADFIERGPLALKVNGGLAWLKKEGMLRSTPMNYLVDFARPNMTAVREYMRIKRAMDAYRGEKHAKFDDHAQGWLKFNAQNVEAAQELADLMHESTLAQVDPSKAYVPGTQPDDESTVALEPNSRGAKTAQERIDTEPARKKAYMDLKARFDALPDEGKRLYKSTRDMYTAQAKELDGIITDNLQRTMEVARDNAKKKLEKDIAAAKKELTGAEQDAAVKKLKDAYFKKHGLGGPRDRKRLQQLREIFESNRLAGPYFPLARFGEYFVSVRDADGEIVSFSKFESLGDAQKYEQEAKKADRSHVVTLGLSSNREAVRGAVDPKFLADVENILMESDVPEDVQDEIWQRYLTSMPDLSMRKRFIHRKGTAGYSRDALRAFASTMFHGAHQLARLKFAPQLQVELDKIREQAAQADKRVEAEMLANEFEERHKWVMTPVGGAAAQFLSSLAFTWNLAATPAAAIINTTQTFMMGVPILGARMGGAGKAIAALSKASGQLLSAKYWKLENNPNLSADEQGALDEFYRLGLIDRTQAHDLAGVGDTGIEYNALKAKVMRKISFMYHHAERINREVTALAAYRMARDKGQGHTEAIEAASDLTWAVHFDYASSNRPRLIQNDAAKVLLIHRQHSINMTYRLFRDLHQSFKGESAAARKEARAQFIGIMGMHALMAGIKGLPFYGAALVAAGFLTGFGEGDDEKMTPEQRLQATLREHLPEWLANIVIYGTPSVASGFAISGRIGFPDFFFRSPNKELEGKDEAWHYAQQFLGAGIGLPIKWYGGLDLMRQGHLERGAEQMMPKALADGFKAVRYWHEGALNLKGDAVIDQFRVWELLGQAAGFTPHRLSVQYDQNAAKKNLEASILRARSDLINKAALAQRLEDGEAFEEIQDEIEKFNDKYPEVGIKPKNIIQNMRTKERNAQRADGGVILNTKLEDRIKSDLSLEEQ